MRPNSRTFQVLRYEPNSELISVPCTNSLAVCLAYVSKQIKTNSPKLKNCTYKVVSTDGSRAMWIDHNGCYCTEKQWKTIQVILGYQTAKPVRKVSDTASLVIIDDYRNTIRGMV